jgi:hypothetical protein
VSWPTEVQEAVERLVVPSSADILEARAVIHDVLSDGSTRHEEDLVGALAQKRGVPQVPAHDEQLVVMSDAGRWPPPSGDELPLVRVRIRHAVREALAHLVREGVVMATTGSIYADATNSIQIKLAHSNGSSEGSLSFPSPLPELGATGSACRWRLTDEASSPRQRLARTELADGLDDLLGVRGIEVLREALACFRQGRFLAAVDLLAAASEAAWFGVGSAAAGNDTKLDSLVARGEMVSDVIERTTAIMASLKVVSQATRMDLRAQAARFRDLRNYGLHPVGDPDADREEAFSEPGSAVLFMTARRYFVQLNEARVELNRIRPGGQA